jgi:hypothetical protein
MKELPQSSKIAGNVAAYLRYISVAQKSSNNALDKGKI